MNSAELFGIKPDCPDKTLENLTKAVSGGGFYDASPCPDFSGIAQELDWIYELQGNLDPRVLLQSFLPQYCWDDEVEVVTFACAAALNWEKVPLLADRGQTFASSFLPFVAVMMYAALLNREADGSALAIAKRFLDDHFKELTN